MALNRRTTARVAAGLCLFGFSFLRLALPAAAQNVVIDRYVPGNYFSPENNLHQLRLYNAGSRPADLSNYRVVTRDYAFVLPEGTRLAPGARLLLGKRRDAALRPDLPMSSPGHPNFRIRPHSLRDEGNYCALLAPGGRVLDAFYHSPLPNAPFLPDSGDCFVAGERLSGCFRLPPENNAVWKYFPAGNDPAVGFERADGNWRPASARPGVDIYQTTAFGDFGARYRDGVMTLRWTTRFERGLRRLEVQRGADPRSFETIGETEARGGARQYADYIFYDPGVARDSAYYYRLKYRDEKGRPAYSKVIEARAVAPPVEFWMKAAPDGPARAEETAVRFYSAYAQRVKIKLLTPEFREAALLFYSPVLADKQNLLRLAPGLPPGPYYLSATTETKRYFERIVIAE